MKIASFVLVLISLVSHNAHSIETLNYNIRQDYLSTRAAGMGNAYTALADDYNALFFNPAGLARLKEGNLNLKIQAGATPEILKLSQEVKEAADKPDTEKYDALTEVIQKNYGNNYWSRVSLGGVYARPNWGLAFIPLDLAVDIAIHQQLGPTLNVEGYQDSVLAYGYAINLGDKSKKNTDPRVSIGATAKAIYRGYVGRAVQASELANNQEYFTAKDAHEGMTVDFDLGSLYTYKVMNGMYHTVGLTARNILDYGFKTNFHLLNDKSSEPPKLGRRFDLGNRFDFGRWWVWSPKLLLDLRDMGHPYWTWKKGLHAGLELDWKVNWWLKGAYRVGLSQMYWTAGASFQFVWFKLDLASWGEEMGTTNAPKENRRYMLQASLDF